MNSISSDKARVDRRLLTVSECAAVFGVHRETVREMIHTGRLRAVQTGGTRGWYRIPRDEVERVLAIGTRLPSQVVHVQDGERWVPVAEAAKRLGVSAEHLHRRQGRHWQLQRFGDDPCIREADVERFEREGIPEPHIEAIAAGSLIEVPAEWCVTIPPGSGGRQHGYVVLRPATMGPHPARQLHVGDIVSSSVGDGAPLDAMVNRGDLACLPIDGGVLALVRALLEREQTLQGHLALQAAYSARRHGDRYLADRMIEADLITEEQFEAARGFCDADDDSGEPVNTESWAARYEQRQHDFATSIVAPVSEVRPGPQVRP